MVVEEVAFHMEGKEPKDDGKMEQRLEWIAGYNFALVGSGHTRKKTNSAG